MSVLFHFIKTRVIRQNIQFLLKSNSSQIIFKNSLYLSNNLAQKQLISQERLAQIKLRQNYNLVYEFNYIKQLRLFSRLKIYQSGISVISALTSLGLYEANYLNDLNAILTANGAMVFALVMLIIISRQTVKFVGKLYLNPNNNKVLISHLNFLGNRRDFEIDLNEIEPFDTVQEFQETFFKLKLKNFNGYMLMSLRFGKIHEKENLKKILKLK